MTYKTLLVHVQPEEAAAHRLKCAVALADDLGAELLGLGAEMLPPAGFADPYGYLEGEWVAAMRVQVERNLEAAETAFKQAVGARRATWRAAHDFPAPTLARTARAADLIIAGGSPLNLSDNCRIADPAELVLTAGRPVLIAPPTGDRLRGQSVVLAWKDTRESRRAAADALPLLRRAQDVVVLEVCEDEQADAATFRTRDVAEALVRHGVPARAKVQTAPDARVCEELNICAQAMNADLIVAGAYGHSRTREWVFGGVTRDLLRHPERFVLLSH